ncbi:MAG TPA: hypothetical protein VKU02_23755 [Gemmataceae bacterium]|nr:hypothetical protein [Gemmataceae bacterium]
MPEKFAKFALSRQLAEYNTKHVNPPGQGDLLLGGRVGVAGMDNDLPTGSFQIRRPTHGR